MTSHFFTKILSITWPCGIPSSRKTQMGGFSSFWEMGGGDGDWWGKRSNLWVTTIFSENASLEFST